MSASDEKPGPMPTGDGSVPPGKPMSFGQHVIDKSAQISQSLKPIKKMSQHVCTFALYSHDMSRQIETHHYVSRVNQDFLQCAVYDSDDSNGRLIGVEYIVSERIFQSLPEEEQKLWHTHAYEITSGLWVNPKVPEMINKSDLQDLAQTYGKFWCTWQVDRGDKLPLGAPSLMMSPQGVSKGILMPELVLKRDDKYKISTDDLKKSRADVRVPESVLRSNADYWMHSKKGFAVDVEETDMLKLTLVP